MKRSSESLKSDTSAGESRERDLRMSFGAVIRLAREGRGLRQQDLAERLGLRQRQISDLERSATDPRLSTIQNVARALDLEVMLVPRHLIAVVQGLESGPSNSSTPMYALEEDDEGSNRDTASLKRPR